MTYYPHLFTRDNQKFEFHFNNPDNTRIIFSGKYGLGKTTFLNAFFNIDKQHTIPDHPYFTIRLSPVNYSITSNEDIFNYIQYDLLTEFLRNGVELASEEFGFSEKVWLFLNQNKGALLNSILDSVWKTGKDLAKSDKYINPIIENFINLYKKINTHYENKYKEVTSSAGLADFFMSEIESNKNSIYEKTLITGIIKSKIEQEKNKGRISVLIIDDLDRIDPEHIFRILNVFSAHFDLDKENKTNKFGIDKVILVCDVENLKHIFEHKYGSNTSFSGFIDKYYSLEVYDFNILKSISESFISISENYKIEQLSSKYIKDLSNINSIFSFLLETFINEGSLTLRKLIKFVNCNSPIKTENINLNNIIISPGKDPMLLYLLLIIKLYGDNHSLNLTLSNLKTKHLPNVDANWEFIVKRLLVVYSITEHNYTKGLDNYKVKINELESDISFDISFYPDNQWEMRDLKIKKLGAPVATFNGSYIIPLLKLTIEKIRTL